MKPQTKLDEILLQFQVRGEKEIIWYVFLVVPMPDNVWKIDQVKPSGRLHFGYVKATGAAFALHETAKLIESIIL